MLFGVYGSTYTKKKKSFLLSDTTQTLIVSKKKYSDLDIINVLKRQKEKKKKRLKVAQHPSICSTRQPRSVPSVPPGSLLERDIMEPRQHVGAHERSAQRNVIRNCWKK